MAGDLVITREAPMGEVCIIPSDLECCLGQRMVLLRPANSIDSRYLLYALQSKTVQEQIRWNEGTGSTVSNLRIPVLEALNIPVPSPAEQRAITAILGTLDDKIELNRRMTETLEAMARALFKSWFVDFDPVRAKSEGRRPPGMDEDTARLFPSEFVGSEFGQVPKGWRSAPLRAWAKVLPGGTPSKDDPSLWDGELPWISPKVMASLHADEAENFVTHQALGNGTRLAPAGSTLVMVRGMGLHQKVRVSQARRDLAFSQDVKTLVPEGIEPTLLLFALLHGQSALLGRVEMSGHGTGKLPTEILLAHPIVMPPVGVQYHLANVFNLLNERIERARREQILLAATRDLLLPQFLSGAIPVGDDRLPVGLAV